MKKVIVVYDINTEDKSGQKRLNRIRKALRRYLHHVQKSVFEGELTDAELLRMKHEIKMIVDRSRDFVIVYSFPKEVKFERHFLTDTIDPTSNIL